MTAAIPTRYWHGLEDGRIRCDVCSRACKLRERPSAGFGRANGVQCGYTGNVRERAGGSTYCPACGELVVERDWHELGAYRLNPEGRSEACGAAVAGDFAGPPGRRGGKRLLPVLPSAT